MPNHDFTTGVDTALAAKIVHRLMTSVRQFPKPETKEDFAELVTEWRDALNYPEQAYRPHIYEEAVTAWLASATSSSWPPMPGDIINQCKEVLERIYANPRRGPEMRAWNEARREARIAEMVGDGNA